MGVIPSICVFISNRRQRLPLCREVPLCQTHSQRLYVIVF
ncbi:hypothetical protein HMPREF0372_02967 [Flavonifractor plautii ATCC 29863]|uniref:Uncharacterized protein n=1 Tax=Flavonifractor plautii ATCC 29863 TaxID=411475 RepID=G9YTV5_FLAPL|nr:hypothetical protein HMPREF0372_02967 [Flavonifractor plautii ATCC 29863]